MKLHFSLVSVARNLWKPRGIVGFFARRQSLLNILGLSVLFTSMYLCLIKWFMRRTSRHYTGTEIIRNGLNVVAHFCLSCNRQSHRRSLAEHKLLWRSFLPYNLSLMLFWNLLNTSAKLLIPSFFEMPFQDCKRHCGSYWTSLKAGMQRQVLLSM